MANIFLRLGPREASLLRLTVRSKVLKLYFSER
jgi:hypothetical protein